MKGKKKPFKSIGDVINIPSPKTIYGLPAKDFLNVVRSMEAIKTVSEKLYFYEKITGRVFDDTTELYKIDGEVIEWTVPLISIDNLEERAEWYIRKYLPRTIANKIASYETRLERKDTIQKKIDLSEYELATIHKLINDKDFPQFLEGHTRAISGNQFLPYDATTQYDIAILTNGMALYELEAHIKERMANHFSDVAQTPKKLNSVKSPVKNTAPDSQTMKDIWNKNRGDAHYNKVINFLCEKNATLDKSFVTKDDEQLVWLANQQYLGAFIKQCRQLNFIPQLPAKKYMQIVQNTFNISIAVPHVFAPGKIFDGLYTDPFENLKNIQ